jgi:hypothetical protein
MAQLQNTTVNGTLTATTFSGNGGSVTGLAASSFSSGQLPRSVAPSGSVIKLTTYVNDTRIAPGAQSNYTMYSFNITKESSTSALIIKGTIPAHSNPNDGNYFFVDCAGSRDFTGIADNTSNSQGSGVFVLQRRTGVAAGTVTIAFGWQPLDGSANLPANAFHSNTSDDGRNRQQGSTWFVWEVAG